MVATLFTMLGLPGSGKSHFARQLAAEVQAVWLNNDGVRSSAFHDPIKPENLHNYKVVYGAMDYATHQILASGHSVVYDANVNHLQERKKNAKIAHALDANAVTVWVKTPLAVAVERVQSREVTAEQFRLTEETIDKHIARFEEPTADEKCIIIDGTLPFDQQLLEFKSQLEELRDSTWQNY